MSDAQQVGNPYEIGLERRDANFAPLTPLGLLQRAAAVHPNQLSVIHGDRRYTWLETYARCRRLASALAGLGVGLGDTVAVMAANTPELYEAHFGVPMTGGVLNALNTRLDAANIGFILNHGQAKVLLTDTEFAPVIGEALKAVVHDITVIDIVDALALSPGERLGSTDYEAFLASGHPEFAWSPPADEWQAISLNYTSGTTGNPKGVVYHHRGAYLLALGNVLAWDLAHHPVYLWTLPMFHCNGWCFPWTMAAVTGTSICLRQVTAASMYDAIHDHGVTCFCGAPIVLNMVINATEAERKPVRGTVKVMTAAAPPPASTLAAMAELGFQVTHVYGLTEVYGPAVVCTWHDEWDAKPPAEQAVLRSRQGVRYHVLEDLAVLDPDTMAPVPDDGETIGEVMFRGNVVMKGYLKNPTATEEAFAGGWFHSGDLGVRYPDGYIQLKDRSKDIIISGGENISSIEIEDVLHSHPQVLAAAVVARQDEKWGETPCAFIELKAGGEATDADEIIAFCRERLAHFKCPRHIVFTELPKTSTGKVQKFVLRDWAENLSGDSAAASSA